MPNSDYIARNLLAWALNLMESIERINYTFFVLSSVKLKNDLFKHARTHTHSQQQHEQQAHTHTHTHAKLFAAQAFD